jgi:hypothetical protein
MIRRKRSGDTIKVTFSLSTESPEGPVSVVGDFNEWMPGANPLVKRANGTRSTSVTASAGSTITFRYLGAGENWFDDPDADAISDEGSRLCL